MAWRFHNALHSFPSFSKDWDRINRQRGNHILLDSRFVEPLVRTFGSEKMLLAVRVSAQEPGMALIERGRPGFWRTFQPGQAPLGAILLAGEVHNPAEPIRELVRISPVMPWDFR